MAGQFIPLLQSTTRGGACLPDLPLPGFFARLGKSNPSALRARARPFDSAIAKGFI
jgi:hypothetical protein